MAAPIRSCRCCRRCQFGFYFPFLGGTTATPVGRPPCRATPCSPSRRRGWRRMRIDGSLERRICAGVHSIACSSRTYLLLFPLSMYLSRGRINLLTIHCRRRRGRCLNHPLPPAGSVRRVLGALGAGLLATIRAAWIAFKTRRVESVHHCPWDTKSQMTTHGRVMERPFSHGEPLPSIL